MSRACPFRKPAPIGADMEHRTAVAQYKAALASLATAIISAVTAAIVACSGASTTITIVLPPARAVPSAPPDYLGARWHVGESRRVKERRAAGDGLTSAFASAPSIEHVSSEPGSSRCRRGSSPAARTAPGPTKAHSLPDAPLSSVTAWPVTDAPAPTRRRILHCARSPGPFRHLLRPLGR